MRSLDHTSFHTNAARRQIGKELENSPSTKPLADHHRAFRIDAVNLKQILGDIQTDRANLAHGRFPSMWLRFDLTTLWHFDAAEWAPSTTSKAKELKMSKKSELLPLKADVEVDIPRLRIRARSRYYEHGKIYPDGQKPSGASRHARS